MQSKSFKVPNIGCDGCVGKIKSEVGQISGVTSVEGDKATKVVKVQWQTPASWQQIEDRLSEIDYPPVEP